MKIILAWIFACAAFLGRLEAASYGDELAKLKEKVGEEKLGDYLSDWRKREPDNSSAWILSANYALQKAQSMEVAGPNGLVPQGNYDLKEVDGAFVIQDKQGKVVGKLGSTVNAAGALQAVEYLQEALKRWPYRLDIHCGLASVFADVSMWDQHMAAISAMAKAAHENAGKLRWCFDEALRDPEEVFVADKIHSFAVGQFNQETKEGDERLLVLAKLVIEVCPASPKGYNDVAVYYGLSKDWKNVATMLAKAAEADPKDSLVWMNIGANSERLKDFTGAGKAYQKAIELQADEHTVAEAKKKLAALKKNLKSKK